MKKLFQKNRERKNELDADELLLSKDTPFAVQEAYKALRTNVVFSLPGLESRCIGITSSAAGEGKSTNIINLAASFGNIGKKVLLIDCDLRRSTIAEKIGIKGQPGLTDCLAGESTVKASIRKIESCSIDVLPAGNIPPDPTVLLESKEMLELIETFKREYDYILIDFPPITAVTDAAILSEQLDGYLLVVKHNCSEYRVISDMIRQLRYINANILGIIYTNAHGGQKGYYRKYYRGYYGKPK